MHNIIMINLMFLQPPEITLDSIKGMDKQVQALHELVLRKMDAFKSGGVSNIKF